MRLVSDRLLLSPSDLNNFLACEHRTGLDLRRARGEITLHGAPRPDAELVAQKGIEHEQAFLERLRGEGREIVAIPDPRTAGFDLAAAAALTEGAMRDGADVVYQAAFLTDDGWRGFGDFLLRVDRPSDLGPYSYEVHDTKLARHPKPYFVVQLAFYTEQVARLQGVEPEHMHVVLGTDERRSFRPRDFAAYVRRVRATFLEYLAEEAEPPYPYPVDHCDHCDWWARCRDRLRADDHLSLVAMLSRPQAIRLEQADVPTMRALAALPADQPVQRLPQATLDGLRQQARLQVHTEDTGRPIRELLALETGRGFLRLPAPSPGDVFFDIEGDPYWGDDGLEYLFGSTTVDSRSGEPRYRALWAHDRAAERRAFEAWVDWVTERLADDPHLHVYHYNHYEPTTLKKLMSRYETREAQVDELLRREVLVDLYAVVRQSMRVGQPSYSLKEMEVFYPLRRDAEVTEAGGSILAYQEWIATQDPAALASIEAYNADDCRSTHGLREWLLAERREAEGQFDTVLPNRDAKPATEFTPAREARRAEVEELRARLVDGLPEEPGELDAEGRARTLLAELLDYHSRESKPGWWAYFDRLTKTPGELVEEDTEAIGCLSLAEDVPRGEEKQSYLYPLRFPAQQHKLRLGDVVDPETEKTVNLVEIDDARGLVWIKRGKRADGEPLPRALVPGRPIPQNEHRAALRRLAERVLERGLEPVAGLDASTDLLLARAPRAAVALPGHADLDGLAQLVAGLCDSALFIQGPPGAGKTWTGARLIVDLMRRGQRVGVAATSHKAIHNLLDEVDAVAAEQGIGFNGLKKSSGDNPESHYEWGSIVSSTTTGDFPPPPEVGLVAGTSWLFAHQDMERQVDVLFVDEAGQVSLADALAMAQAARSVVLLGDPQQLAHVSQGTHPGGSGASVLRHLLGDAQTVAPECGVFLDRTHRMHPEVCRFVSEAMYDGRLEAEDKCRRRAVRSPGLDGSGVRLLEVAHDGNRQTAPEEVTRIAEEIVRLLDGGRTVGCDGTERALTIDDVLVVAPYNAQVRALQAGLPDGARVGTVDKFQGQEAPVVFFSMTSSTSADVPRGMDFLFSRNRLNVAVSRAQCLAVVVCSPRLLTASCTTVEQMRLVNALCQFADLAEEQAEGARAESVVR